MNVKKKLIILVSWIWHGFVYATSDVQIVFIISLHSNVYLMIFGADTLEELSLKVIFHW